MKLNKEQSHALLVTRFLAKLEELKTWTRRDRLSQRRWQVQPLNFWEDNWFPVRRLGASSELGEEDEGIEDAE